MTQRKTSVRARRHARHAPIQDALQSDAPASWQLDPPPTGQTRTREENKGELAELARIATENNEVTPQISQPPGWYTTPADDASSAPNLQHPLRGRIESVTQFGIKG